MSKASIVFWLVSRNSPGKDYKVASKYHYSHNKCVY